PRPASYVLWVTALTTAWMLAAAGFAAALLCLRELRRRRELVARACHELRGPLTAVRLCLATMERRGEAPPERLAALELERRRAGGDRGAPRRPRPRLHRGHRRRAGAAVAGDRADAPRAGRPRAPRAWPGDRIGDRRPPRRSARRGAGRAGRAHRPRAAGRA